MTGSCQNLTYVLALLTCDALAGQGSQSIPGLCTAAASIFKRQPKTTAPSMQCSQATRRKMEHCRLGLSSRGQASLLKTGSCNGCRSAGGEPPGMTLTWPSDGHL
ncbi:hypothetical protein KIL84_021028 [Mauremys mutica]|uniref:Secreted protein n=1 Tax=Mauremys mutica TaxID=74926 RepID=A0A9D4B0G5_9SAUR|nr:hypothetical protein KIL84_021028 [Mauremys mutica]